MIQELDSESRYELSRQTEDTAILSTDAGWRFAGAQRLFLQDALLQD